MYIYIEVNTTQNLSFKDYMLTKMFLGYLLEQSWCVQHTNFQAHLNRSSKAESSYMAIMAKFYNVG